MQKQITHSNKVNIENEVQKTKFKYENRVDKVKFLL